MSDLISRSALIRNISKVCGDLGIELPDQVIDMITAQPIAYDVEKVVAELEKAESVKNFGSVNSRNLLIPLNDAIDIVKAGGVK